MDKDVLKQKIDELVENMTSSIASKLGDQIDSITLTGSYAINKLSLEKPNINILVFAKANPSADLYLEIGRILYGVGKKYLDFFKFRVEPFPFRFAQPIGNQEIEVSVNLNIFEVTSKALVTFLSPKDQMWTPFGATELLLQVFKVMRKVVYGSDVLGSMEFHVTHKNILMDTIREFPTFRLQLTRAPMTYDIDQDYELLALEALEIGKACLGRTAEILLSDEDLEKGKHVFLISNKTELLKFLKQNSSPDIASWAETIIESRDNFNEVKKNKTKVMELYHAAYNILNSTFEIALHKFNG